jgi:hypothetical protein
MTEEEIIDELTRLGIDWALEEEPESVTAEVTTLVEVDPAEWVAETAGVPPDRAFVVTLLLDSTEVTDEAEVEGEREVSAVYGYFSDDDRLEFAYGADYPLIEPDEEEDEEFDDEEFNETEEQWS